ncbi:MAG: hypothetical protein KKB20_22590 [Proteobacteria bacterium]|nr:hypothetical protein [Pseudomonadota bacterium]
MKKFLFFLLKLFVVLLLLGLLAVGMYFLVQYLKWPWWAGLAIGLGIVGLILAAFFMKKWFFRRREEKFVKRIIEHDDAAISGAPRQEQRRLRDLQERWKEAVEILRRSQLKKRGDPLYALPWFMMMGEAGSGKTTAIQSARLHSPLTDVSPTSGISGTRNCDWWFFEKAILLDTAGRYAIPVDEGPDKEEWKKFLSLLTKYRRKEPINGLIVTVAADKLLSAGPDALAEDGRSIRRRIDETMRALGAKFPVYVLVTKTDKVLGLTGLSDVLPPGLVEQAMGQTNNTLKDDPAGMVMQTMEAVTDRLKDVRLLLLSRNPGADPGLLLFPDELASIQPGLMAFVEAAFEQNPYQETPVLRGLYFSSGRQEGSTYSQLLGDLTGFKGLKEDLPGTDQGLFLRDFFSRILPGDRSLLSPLWEYVAWRRMTRSLGLMAWLAVMLCLAGLLSLSYYKNIEIFQAFTKSIQKPPKLTRDLSKDLLAMDDFRDWIEKIHTMNSNWFIPRLGLHQSLDLEQRVKDYFCMLFRKGFLDRLDQTLEENIANFSATTPEALIGSYVEHLETRVNLLGAELGGASVKKLQGMPKPAYEAIVAVDPKLIPELAADFGPLYLAFLDWNRDRQGLAKEQRNLRSWLQHLALIKGTNLHWLVNWANVQPDMASITLGDFWGSQRVDPSVNVHIPAAYTVKGRQQIDQFLKEFEASLEDPKILKDRRPEFDDWYWREYIKAWWSFGDSFDSGHVRTLTDYDRRQLAQEMADLNNPYFNLLDRMATELKPLVDREGTPSWVKMAVSFKDVRQMASEKATTTKTGLLTRVTQAGEKVAQEGTSIIRGEVRAPGTDVMKELNQIASEAETLNEFEKALGSLIPMTTSRQSAFSMASEFYSGDSDSKKDGDGSSFQSAHSALTKLWNAASSQSQQEDLFWHLLSGPLYFLLGYATQEASCELQTKWEGQVLAEIQYVPTSKLSDTLFKKADGLVWKFVTGPAAAFLGRGRMGYFPRTSMDQQFPFKKDFLVFLDSGSTYTQAVLPQYKVTLTALPINVNKGAFLEPHAVTLTLNCDKGAQILENFNFATSHEFTWTPDGCADVTVQILFDDFTLTKTYSGANGFPLFLQDFLGGSKTFTQADFKDFEMDLKSINIKTIQVAYKMSGDVPVRKLLHTDPLKVPKKIASCWEP